MGIKITIKIIHKISINKLLYIEQKRQQIFVNDKRISIMIINAISNNNNNIDIIQCLSNLCLSHPIIIISSKTTVPKQ